MNYYVAKIQDAKRSVVTVFGKRVVLLGNHGPCNITVLGRCYRKFIVKYS